MTNTQIAMLIGGLIVAQLILLPMCWLLGLCMSVVRDRPKPGNVIGVVVQLVIIGAILVGVVAGWIAVATHLPLFQKGLRSGEFVTTVSWIVWVICAGYSVYDGERRKNFTGNG